MTDNRGSELSIIIVSYNTKDFLRTCLSSIAKDSSGLAGEIIVIDNCSSDGSAEMIEGEFPEVTLVKNTANLGYAKAVNQGIRQAKGRYFLVLNPDIEITDGAIENLWAFMETHPGTGIAGGKLLNPDGTLQMSCRTFYTFRTVLLRRTFIGKVFPNSGLIRDHLMLDWDHASDRRVDWVTGACMIVRRRAYEAVGGMDERFFLYFEDVDWCYRMKKHGWEVWYVHSAVMRHHHRRESARLVRGSTLVNHLFSSFRFYDKWSPTTYVMKRERRVLALVGTMALDIVLINLSFILAYYFRYAIMPFLAKPLFSITIYRGFMIFVNIVCLFSFVYSGLYRGRGQAGFIKDLIRVSRALLLSSLVIMAATYLTRTIAYSRIIVFVFWPISALLVTTGRAIQRSLHHRLRRGLFDLRRVVIVGEDEDAVSSLVKAVSRPGSGYDFAGYVRPAGRGAKAEMRPLVGDADDIGNLVAEHRIDEVLICDKELSRDDMGRIIISARSSGAEVKVVSEVTDMLIRGSLVEDIAGIPVVVFPPARLTGTNLVTKCISDYVVGMIAFVGLIALAPAVFILQSLTYRNYSAWVGALKQLELVLVGERSLVGPKQPISGESVKPGIIGVWLTAGEPADEIEQSKLDMYYLQNWSVSTDIEIMILTLKCLPSLFRGSGVGGTTKEGEI